MPKGYSPPASVDELLMRYHAGERNFSDTKLSAPVFNNIEFSDIDLSYSVLADAQFDDSLLTNANLEGSELSGATFHRTTLADCNLSRAKLYRASIYSSTFLHSLLVDVDMLFSNVVHADFPECTFSTASLGDSVFIDVDISSLCVADPPVQQFSPSYIDHSTIMRSLRAVNLKDFLLRSGMPGVFVEYMVECARSLDERGLFSLMQTTFISYGGPDTAFAQKLYDALHANGVTTFFFPEHAVPGRKLHRLMREGVNKHDRVILICSQSSLVRLGVLNEIQETLAREARDGGAEYLIPIRLDDYIFKGWSPADPGAAQAIRDRVVADFEGTDSDPAKFNQALLRLLAALKK
ncbi:toll/interleukin-1 receptor domain-containing protein [Myxococcus sp. CA039A]|uniref:toll/interleukin-1 receptor domain-containing protein n=1 Tax=Myxococcus sp. CA039A TaxID=2741737 RepID=UPI00157A8D0E|nr:toll/interleukin-1 receptor domain-containing protein [Myxococcus sp. CA039A]NTX56977.1 toll/interleukin-1 receptor domain-containing protein [Myxococcus sp. CA039A]